MIIYDASDLIVGRLSSKVAKDALLGKEIVVVNCENSILSGSRTWQLRSSKVFRQHNKNRLGIRTGR